MRFSKYCPKHGKGPGWLIYKEPTREIVNCHVENDEMVVRVRYQPCICTIEYRQPYKGVNSVDGYIYISGPNGYQPEHRFIWEQAHGKLNKGMVVHHINGLRTDNRLENLIALPKRKHNNNMPEPFTVNCPHCQKPIRIIKQRGKEPICLQE